MSGYQGDGAPAPVHRSPPPPLAVEVPFSFRRGVRGEVDARFLLTWQVFHLNPPKLLFLLCLIVSSCGTRKKSPPLSPEDALKTFQLPEGFRIGLVASEPLITDPVEIAFDADGLLYVAEMEDYPATGDAGGRIVVLEDKDDDGFYEKGNVFADGLPYVNGVMPWRKGVLVTSAPDILYLEDSDGDRRADIREVVLTGFAFTNPQLRVSSLRYGIDNWIYGAYSRAGGQRGYPEFTNHGKALRFPSNPRADSADIYPGTDFRFRPDSFDIQPAGGMSQFGMAFDATGNRFTVWNNIHVRHVVMDGRYANNNPWHPVTNVMAAISDHGNAAPVFSRAENRLDLHESEIGHFTSACGLSVYTGDLFQPPYDDALFVCEPVSNIVHVDKLARKGGTFSASRIEEGKEFLSSTDSWFRPVNTTVGPDGGLYVVDFYRKLVEHPAWIARADDKGIYTHAGVLQEKDFLEGNDRGRIYRIVPKDHKRTAGAQPKLSTAFGEELVRMLAHPNMWWRINAQRLLVERQDTAVMPALKKLFREATTAEAKTHALRTLQGLRVLEDDLILTALDDKDPGVRKQAILMAEERLSIPAIRDRVASMASDADESVQLQVAMTLSMLPGDVSLSHLQHLPSPRLDDEWFRDAVMLSVRDNAMQWYDVATTLAARHDRGNLTLLGEIASVVGARCRGTEISQLLSTAEVQRDSAVQRFVLEGLSEGLSRSSAVVVISNTAQEALVTMMMKSDVNVQPLSIHVAEKLKLQRTASLQSAVNESLRILRDRKASPDQRAHSVSVAGLPAGGVGEEVFAALLTPKEPEEVQSAAARVLTARQDPAAMQVLAEKFNSSTPEVRAIIESGFTRSAKGVSAIIASMEKGVIDPALVSPAVRNRLLQHPDKTIGQRAQKLVAHVVHQNREQIVTAYYESTTLRGDAAKGKELFRKTCSTCHQLQSVGRAFGPDLLSVGNQTRINLLTMIIDPNNNIAPGYDGYFVETTDGRTLTGILGNETSSSVTLRTPEKEETIIRDRIQSLRPMSTSLMPEGLEANLTKHDMADLLEYVKNGENRKK